MSKFNRILKYSLIFLVIAIFTGCAPTRKNTWVAKRKEASRVNTSRLGRNRFFYSTNYQKKLQKNYRRKRY
jgi:uncharacterized membrane protein YjdF